MVGVIKTDIQNIPSLVVAPLNKQNEPLPVVIYFHGFTSSKEFNLPVAFLLAEEGYRVILPDSEYHGDRAGDITVLERKVAFWDIVKKNVEELGLIKDYLNQNNLLKNELVGIAGTSMGGITTASALTQYDWIKAAAVLMGSPKMTDYATLTINKFQGAGDLPITDEELNELFASLKSLDLSLNQDKLSDRPILFWHGDADNVVPAEHAKSFHEDVKDTYENKEYIKMILEPNRAHKVSRYAILETVKWFEKHLTSIAK